MNKNWLTEKAKCESHDWEMFHMKHFIILVETFCSFENNAV